uniref:Uncharacterized protein n=1 Tax=Solanum tuberosum TaxID=4113 RepID=M1BPV8_SOLTU
MILQLLQNKTQEDIGIKVIDGHLSDDIFLYEVAKDMHDEFQELILDVNWDPFHVVEVEEGVSIY